MCINVMFVADAVIINKWFSSSWVINELMIICALVWQNILSCHKWTGATVIFTLFDSSFDRIAKRFYTYKIQNAEQQFLLSRL